MIDLKQVVLVPVPVEATDVMEEIQRSAIFLFTSSSNLADAQRDFREAKMNLETVEAEEDIKIRRDAAETNSRITEASISAMVSMNPRVLEAKKALNDALYRIDACKAVHESLNERIRSLHEMVQILKLTSGLNS